MPLTIFFLVFIRDKNIQNIVILTIFILSEQIDQFLGLNGRSQL